jgi:pimeloyl-ACP methyl ester carboxylesterase
MTERHRLVRWREWYAPIPPVSREVLHSLPEEPDSGVELTGGRRPPLLFVAGYGHGAWAFAERWLEHSAQRGYPAYAMSLRGQGDSGRSPRTTLRAYGHDVVQVAARLPRQTVLIGHGVGGLAVAHAMTRYPAKAGVLVAPVFGGLSTLLSAVRHNPIGTLPAIVGGRLRVRRRQLFGRELAAATAREYAARMGGANAPLVQWQLLLRRGPAAPVGKPPVLVVGSPDDKVVPRRALERAARLYRGAPLLFPGMGHDLMLDARWKEPIDAILDWLDKNR